METENEEFIDGIAESKIKLFLGDNADYYLDKWKASDDPKKKAGWNWAAFLGSILWLGYRKMYAIIIQLIGLFFVLDIIRFYTGADLKANIGLVLGGILGVSGTSFYYKHMLKKIKNINEKSFDSERRNEELEKAGGRSWGGVGITVLIVLLYITVSSLIFGA